MTIAAVQVVLMFIPDEYHPTLQTEKIRAGVLAPTAAHEEWAGIELMEGVDDAMITELQKQSSKPGIYSLMMFCNLSEETIEGEHGTVCRSASELHCHRMTRQEAAEYTETLNLTEVEVDYLCGQVPVFSFGSDKLH